MDNYTQNLQENQAVNTFGTSFFTKTFGWMFLGLLITAITSIAVAAVPAFRDFVFGSVYVYYGIILTELAVVFFFSARASKMSFGGALFSYLLYAFLNGVTISYIFFFYNYTVIISAFAAAALMFGLFAIYGTITKKDLSSVGSMLIMGLIGILVASLINVFIASTALDWIITYAGIAIFLALTAYDIQKIKKISMSGEAVHSNLAIVMALEIYLDFINIFLRMLRVLNKRR